MYLCDLAALYQPIVKVIKSQITEYFLLILLGAVGTA